MVTSSYFLFSGVSLILAVIFGVGIYQVNNQNSVNTAPANGKPTVTASPSKNAPALTSRVTRSGKFVNGEHPTKGSATVFIENGQWFVELDQEFSTDKGPDLFVILHRHPNVIGSSKPPEYSIKEGDYILIAPLGKVTGQQRYPIPSNIKPTEFQSVAIWCRQFNATFGAASLQN